MVTSLSNQLISNGHTIYSTQRNFSPNSLEERMNAYIHFKDAKSTLNVSCYSNNGELLESFTCPVGDLKDREEALLALLYNQGKVEIYDYANKQTITFPALLSKPSANDYKKLASSQ